MSLQDLWITPLFATFILFVAYKIRLHHKEDKAYKYYLPALVVKMVGALALGIIYQFYYGGGDTFNFLNQSNILFEIFQKDPLTYFQILLTGPVYNEFTYPFVPSLYWYNAPTEFFIVRIVSFLGLITFNTYSSIALVFAVFSFSGSWALYKTFLKLFPGLEQPMAVAVFFIPSVFFWGSGIMKDTIGIGALGWLVSSFYTLVVEKKNLLRSIIQVIFMMWLISQVRMYLLLSFLPAAAFWLILENNNKISSKVIRWLLKPLFLAIAIGGAFAATYITKGHSRYDIDKLGELTKVNAEYLYYVSVKDGGSAYYLGELDGSVASMLRLAPAALVVSLFRPWIWEAKNPIMLLSALESFLLMILLIKVIVKVGLLNFAQLALSRPFLIFAFTFSIVFAIAVGLNSFNFGTLVRYKIPLLPFMVAALLMMESYSKLKMTFKSAL